MPAVLLGFALVLTGAALLAFPAGVARTSTPGDDEVVAVVHVVRGAEALARAWAEEAPEVRS
jgi:hypothetical protein